MRNKFLLGLLGLLGFSSCVFLIDDDDDGGSIAMYGVARSSFVVKGAVTDADENPLAGIRVVLKLRDDETDENLAGAKRYRDTVYTDAKGEFKTRPRPDTNLPLVLIATDMDGEENGGEFEREEKEFRFYGGDFDYDERVYVNEMNFTLTEKSENDESE